MEVVARIDRVVRVRFVVRDRCSRVELAALNGLLVCRVPVLLMCLSCDIVHGWRVIECYARPVSKGIRCEQLRDSPRYPSIKKR